MEPRRQILLPDNAKLLFIRQLNTPPCIKAGPKRLLLKVCVAIRFPNLQNNIQSAIFWAENVHAYGNVSDSARFLLFWGVNEVCLRRPPAYKHPAVCRMGPPAHGLAFEPLPVCKLMCFAHGLAFVPLPVSRMRHSAHGTRDKSPHRDISTAPKTCLGIGMFPTTSTSFWGGVNNIRLHDTSLSSLFPRAHKKHQRPAGAGLRLPWIFIWSSCLWPYGLGQGGFTILIASNVCHRFGIIDAIVIPRSALPNSPSLGVAHMTYKRQNFFEKNWFGRNTGNTYKYCSKWRTNNELWHQSG